MCVMQKEFMNYVVIDIVMESISTDWCSGLLYDPVFQKTKTPN